MRRRTPLQRAYLLLLGLLFLCSSGAVALAAPEPDLATIALAGVCGVVALGLNLLLVRLETSTPDSPVFVDLTPAVFIFTLLSTGPLGLAALLLAATLARWIKQRWHQPYGYLFNAADISISYSLLLAIAGALWSEPGLPAGLAGLIGGVVLMGAFVVVSTLYGGLLTSVGAGRPFGEVLRTVYMPTAWVSLIPLSLGLLGAGLYARAPWLLPFVIIPLALAYQALQSIAAWLAASQQLRSLNAELQEAKHHLEQRVEERTADLLAANAALARIQRNREQEVTDAAHDIDQVLRSAVHTLSADPEGPRSRGEQVALLAPAMEVLEDMKLAARLRNNSLTLIPRPTDLVALLAETVERVRPRYRNANCLLSVEVLDDIPPICCDGPRLRRVFLNLLDNALIFTCQRPDGAVTLAVTADEAAVSVAVRDNGTGIAADDLRRIGERFFRVAQGTERPEGSGIGLSCSTRIVALSGGELLVDSAGLGRGTTVTVRLPGGNPQKSAADESLAPLDLAQVP